MELTPAKPRDRKISGVTRNYAWTYTPGEPMTVPDEVGRVLLASGAWVETEQRQTMKITRLTDQYTLEDVLREGETRMLDALFDGSNEVMQVLVKYDLDDLAQLAFQQKDYSHTLFASEAVGRCTSREIKLLYGTPLEDFGIKRFKDELRMSTIVDTVESAPDGTQPDTSEWRS